MAILRLGFLINPLAGTGGPTANKGSDNLQLIDYIGREDELNANRRAAIFLQAIRPVADRITILSVRGLMGGNALNKAGFTGQFIEFVPPQCSTSADTATAAQQILLRGVDILVFVGGDGTARDICQLVAAQCPDQLVLGVPAGVKMHSAVYAVNPQSAAELVRLLAGHEILHTQRAEVRDIDETAFRLGLVKSCHYGTMAVPVDGRFVQQVKQGGFEVEELVLWEITDYLKELWDENTLIIFGPGSTLLNIQHNLGLPASLLGFDVVKASVTLKTDANSVDLQGLIARHSGKIMVIITVIGGQGHIIGRGNQQLTVDILSRLGKAAVSIIATKTKLASLDGRCLLMDSGDPDLDALWQGFIPVICGYQEILLYPLGGN